MSRNLIAFSTAMVLILAFASGGAVASDDDLEFAARLNGAQEVPPVDTTSRGRFWAEIDDDYQRLDVRLRVRTARYADVGLLGVAGAHIHCGDAVTNGPVIAFLAGVIPGGVEGVYRAVLELTDTNIMATACGSNLREVVESMIAGDTYVNVHSLTNPGGEVRGQIYLADDD